jgi:hypothetical protein
MTFKEPLAQVIAWLQRLRIYKMPSYTRTRKCATMRVAVWTPAVQP